jgi:thiol-disulfide isomerase/thioredoxin
MLQAQLNRIIERPAFDAWNSSTLEFDKIEINDTATIFYIDAFYRPKNWIRIDSKIYIQESGTNNKLLIKGTEGIELDKKFWMPESGEVSFKLIFPPLTRDVKKVDFIESDCEDCFKTWGIYLDPGAKPEPIRLPEEVFKSLEKADDSPLPPVKLHRGIAVLSGKLLGNILPVMTEKPLFISFQNPITKSDQEYEVKIQNDGTFRAEIMVDCPTIANCYHFFQSVVLIPGEETKIYVDIHKMYRQQSRYQKDKTDNSPAFYVVNSLNLTGSDLNYIADIPMLFDRRQLLKDVYEMDAAGYKSYVLNKNKELTEIISKTENISVRGKQIAVSELNIYTILHLFSYVQNSKISYVMANELDYNDIDNIPYNPEEPDVTYYSFLKDFSLNDSQWLYSPSYLHIITLIRNSKVYDIKEVTSSMSEWKKITIDKLKKDIGNDSGIFYDLMTAQEYATQLEDMKLFTDVERTEINRLFENKTFVEELFAENDNLIRIRGDLSKKSGFTINEIPEVSQDKVFETILEKYKGKVIFVDFWATWCGPCIRAMKAAEPVKATFEGKDVVFLYLTGTTSPVKKWQEMVPAIHGEHYRVSEEQWKYWHSKLNIEGVPTYFIYDRQGNQKRMSAGFMGVDKMKKWISESL